MNVILGQIDAILLFFVTTSTISEMLTDHNQRHYTYFIQKFNLNKIFIILYLSNIPNIK